MPTASQQSRGPSRALSLVALFLALGPALVAQAPAPAEVVLVRADVTDPIAVDRVDVAPPPAPPVGGEERPKHASRAIPVADHGLPEPQTPESTLGDLGAQPETGAFTLFRNQDHRPAGAPIVHPGEPSAIEIRDVYFATGNTYGSLSRDSGMTWAWVNPATRFPPVDGGVCCDQRVIYDAVHDLAIWYIQYGYSASTGKNGVRIAVCSGRDNLRNANFSRSIYLDPLSFGLGTGMRLDFPDVATTAEYLYCACNVFGPVSGDYKNSLVWRIPLQSLLGNLVPVQYYKRNGGTNPMGGGRDYRFTQTYNGSPGTTMFWATHTSTASIRIFAWADSSGGRAADVDRLVPSWNNSIGKAPGPDGRDWLGDDDHRIASGYASGGEGGFLWSSKGNGGSRPQNYVRVCRFRQSDRAIVGNDDIWNGSYAFGYPACGVNSLGHKGVVMAAGSATEHVFTVAFLVDNYAGWGGALFGISTGTNGSPSNRWGDYFTVVANRIDTRTFVGTGMEMNGGTAGWNAVHRTAWFGRDDYTPAWVGLSVTTAPSNGLSITVDETDRNGLKDGLTPFSRSYTPRQGYTLTAPASYKVRSGQTYVFHNWTGTGGTSSSRFYHVPDIGVSAASATANYSLQTIVTVTDSNVAGSVLIVVGTTDLDGFKNGTTTFLRRYKIADGPFSFTAPASAGVQPFHRWYVANVAQPVGQQTISIAPTTDAVTIQAEYCSHVHGGYTSYGAGCRGSNGQVPLHASASHPDIGTTVVHTVSGLPGPTLAVMILGTSKTDWNGTPLPLGLGFLGGDPSCQILASVLVAVPMTVVASGTAMVPIPVANDPAAIGVHFYTQGVANDPLVGWPLEVITSNGLDMTVGGSSIGGGRCGS